MKALKLTLIVPLLVFAISCKKTGSTATVTVDEAADMAAGSVAQNSFGFSSVADNVGVNAQTLYSVSSGGQAVNTTSTVSHQACGTTVADSLTGSGNSSSVTYSFFYKYMRTLNCNTASQPDNLLNVVTFRGNYDGPRLTSADAGTASVTVAGLTTTATNYAINGTYTRKGTFTSKEGAKATGTSNVEIKATNVLLSKPDRTIISGTATVAISGTAGGSTFSYTGTLVFNGSNKATLTVGTTNYVINLLTGAYVK
ncbi:hypothetical protein [Mucilaginibacter sp.]|uniref:hypothetical protein n=1 Tax=Mucilaginibacter sp. TaxID=1882438 RepID=UPI002616F2EC|nr:hypothetical protein [Mucilaginibacter sp.]MDB5031353.1 hypothetical protein [Mucilaginibacter sp.]